MKRLIIALAMLMPTFALAAPTNYEILNKGRLISSHLSGMPKNTYQIVLVLDYVGTIFRCTIYTDKIGCGEVEGLNKSSVAK